MTSCSELHRIDALEKDVDEIKSDVKEVRKDQTADKILLARFEEKIDQLTDTIEDAIKSAKEAKSWMIQARNAIIFWLVPIVGSGILWSIIQSTSQTINP